MKAFISYSHKDKFALGELHSHLSMVKRNKEISIWFDHEILVGENIDQKIFAEFESSDLFIPLISRHFLESEYCYTREMVRAFERSEKGLLLIFPIIIAPCDWQSSPLKNIRCFPNDNISISESSSRDRAWTDAVEELRRLISNQLITADMLKVENNINQPKPAKKYKSKKEYNAIEKSDFRDLAFEQFKIYFSDSINELKKEGFSAKYYEIDNNSFGSTIVNNNISRGVAHITIHKGVGHSVMGDIYYCFEEYSPTHTAHGNFCISSNEYDLLLDASSFEYMCFGESFKNKLVSLIEAAELVWGVFLKNAGIEHA